MANKSFFDTFKKIALSTPALIVISSLLTVSVTLSVFYLLPKQKTLSVPYSYFLSEYDEISVETLSPTDTISLDAVASNNAISISLVKDGNTIKGIDFSVTVKKGSVGDTQNSGKTYSDSNSDGIIYIKNLSAGVYTVYPKSVEEPYSLSAPVEATVVSYKPDKNILNKTEADASDDTVALKNNSAQKNEADEKDTSNVTFQYIIPDKDKAGNILYKVDSITKNYMTEAEGKIYCAQNSSDFIMLKGKAQNEKLTGYPLKKETVDKNLPRVKAVTEFLVKETYTENGQNKTRYDLYRLSCYTHTSETVIKTGWNIIGGKRYYYNKDKKRVTGWQYIGGNRYYFNKSGVLKSVKGIDVSVHQGNIDWKKVAADGINYAIIRAAYRGYETGKLVVDPKFERNIKGALNNGIEVGVYIFSQAVNAKEAVEEASLLLKLCEKYEVTFPYVIDIEGANGKGTGRADKISVLQRTEVINAFCATIRAGGKKPMLYTGMWYYASKIDKSKLCDCPLWIAYYPVKSKKTVSPSTKGYDIWQYSSSGSVDGIAGRVDMNAMINRQW